MVYLLDTNIFIEAKNRYYAFDFCPAFWDWIDAANESEKVFSIEKVADELIGGGDELADWVEHRKSELFLKPDPPVVPSLQEVSRWVSSQDYDAAAVTTFLQVADYYLIAQAHAHEHVVVTHELVRHSTKKIKIPSVCIGLGIKCMSPFEMLRTERAKFVLGGNR
ncbi:MAG: DUF4411 family protein [Actinomycetota bacterium]